MKVKLTSCRIPRSFRLHLAELCTHPSLSSTKSKGTGILFRAILHESGQRLIIIYSHRYFCRNLSPAFACRSIISPNTAEFNCICSTDLSLQSNASRRSEKDSKREFVFLSSSKICFCVSGSVAVAFSKSSPRCVSRSSSGGKRRRADC